MQEENPPIQVKSMEAILMDIHLAEAYSSLLTTDSIEKKTINKNTDSLALFYKQILANHHTTLVQFEDAIKWYSLHPQLLDTVYNNIMPVFDSLKTLHEKPQ